MENIVLFTHTDLDGVACEILAKVAFNDDLKEVIPAQPNSVDRELTQLMDSIQAGTKSVDTIYITDLCPTTAMVERLSGFAGDRNIKVVILDHHKRDDMRYFEHIYYVGTPIFTAYEKMIHDDIKTMETELTCGAFRLACHLKASRYFVNMSKAAVDNIFIFAEIVRLYDTWEWKKAPADIADNILGMEKLMHIKQDFIEAFYLRLSGATYHSDIMTDTDKELIRAQRWIESKAIKSALKSQKFAPLGIGVNALVLTVSGHSSTICDYVFEHKDETLWDDWNVILTINPVTYVCSVRSGDHFINAYDIAKFYGGGGHPKAAGFSFEDFDAFANFRSALLTNRFINNVIPHLDNSNYRIELLNK